MTIEEFIKTQSMTEKTKYKRKILIYILILVCLIIIIFSLYNIFEWYLDNSKIRQINKEIEENTDIDNNSKQGELVNPPKNKDSNYYYYASIPFYQVNFAALSTLNKDTVAFIRMRNTNVKYPVVQSSDNNFYLTHSFDKEENNAGWIFMDYRNDIDNLNDNTIIYGHARINGTMFGSLKNALSHDWQNDRDNYVIFLSTPKENMIFQIFSIYTIKRESYYITTNFTSSNEKQKWIDTMKTRNIAPIDTEVNIDDKFLTLSTCQNYKDGRIVIQAKLIKKQKRLD